VPHTLSLTCDDGPHAMAARPRSTSGERLDPVLGRIAGRAGELDREPRFPSENFADLAAAGALTPPPGGLAGEVALVRAVAAADASTARILDGHLNGIERLTLACPEPLRSAELEQIGTGGLGSPGRAARSARPPLSLSRLLPVEHLRTELGDLGVQPVLEQEQVEVAPGAVQGARSDQRARAADPRRLA